MKTTMQTKPATPPAAMPAPAPAPLAAVPVLATQPPAHVVPRPNADLLCGIQWSELQPGEEKTLREQLLARAVKSLTKMSALRLQKFAEFVDLCEKDRGCDTPAEEFILSLVSTHYACGLTPDDVAEDLEDFRASFDYMAESAKMFKERYPTAFKSATAA
jgi:hypothetical protein